MCCDIYAGAVVKGSWECVVTYPTYRILLAIVAAAIVACFFTIITATADQIENSRMTEDGPYGAQCSQQAWPYYEAACLVDQRVNRARPKLFRVVTTEREQSLRMPTVTTD